MLGYLLVLFTLLPLLELALLIHIGGYIGAWNTVAVVVVTGAAGALLARTQGIGTLYRIRDSINSGVMPGEEIINGILILLGGATFLTPGFITDLAGFLLLVPFTRVFIKTRVSRKIRRMVDEGRIITMGR